MKDEAQSFHDKWQSCEVVVWRGPFMGWWGMVRATYNPRVEVCFPKTCPHTERIWFHTRDLCVVHRTRSGEPF